MCHSPLKFVYMLVVALSALGAVHLGLLALGYDMLTVLHLSHAMKTVYMLFGAAGVATLVLLAMKCCSHHEHCNCAPVR